LAFTRREAQSLLALAPAGQAQGALDFDANRAAAAGSQLQHFRYVHFATHGFLVDAHPDLSGLVLSLVDREGRAQPGLMTTADVFDMHLDAQLVVLSGCRTALGRELRGEGLVGLARAFMYAGARGVLASLWQVDDAATAELMTSLYRGLLQRGEAPAAALRGAQRELLTRRRFRHPYYWAAFQLQGDGR
jgi:CHAT domain-containing protein